MLGWRLQLLLKTSETVCPGDKNEIGSPISVDSNRFVHEPSLKNKIFHIFQTLNYCVKYACIIKNLLFVYLLWSFPVIMQIIIII